MSLWNISDLRGTMKEMGSTYPSLTVLKQRSTSLSCKLIPRFGKNAIPRWGSGDEYSDRYSNLSFAYS
jgi:hypothetical protein